MEITKYILALDVGGRRIGVALASTAARIAAPLTTLDREASQDIQADIAKLVSEHQIATVVVGLPRGMGGQETAQTAAIRAFVSELEKKLEVPVVLQDEAGTSLQAEDNLKALGKPYSKADIDASAAAIILNDYLQAYVARTG